MMLIQVSTPTAMLNGWMILMDLDEFDASKEFHISDEQFKIYKGHIALGAHTKDWNGGLRLPVSVVVKMKKLNVG